LDEIRKKLSHFAITNARRINAPGIGLFALVMVTACLSNSGDNKRSPVGSSAADSIARARQDSVNRTMPGYVVDSILPVEEELRRFRVAVGGSEVTALQNAAPSRDSLVKTFIHALAVSDSVGLKNILLNAREFALLVYPETQYTKPPYTQAPALVWNQIQNPAASGFTRLVRRLGGKKLQYEGYECSSKPDRQGKNVLWTKCMVRAAEPNEAVRARRLFGSIIERDGRFKFVSYANEF
jgi:hypothetical protein